MEQTLKYRVTSIDILRGIVMIIMAIDHTRDFFHQPAMLADPLNPENTTLAIYFTRWITHFCAPTFVFLSGVSAYLSSLKKTKKQAAIFLIKRGAWLVLIEVTVVTFGITFNPFFNFIVFQVIWAIGWSMIILGLLSFISYRIVLMAGLILFFGHDLFDSIIALPKLGSPGGLISTLLFTAFNSIIPLNNTHVLADFYAILPWTGVMLLGYSIGYWFKKDIQPARRKKLLFVTGITLVLLFIVLRATGIYGDPSPVQPQETFMRSLFSFLNASKYPPSLQYLCMTLGPACLLLAAFEHVKNKWTDIVSVYGSVPFFYYILHFYLLHIILVIVFFATGHTTAEVASPGSPFAFRPVIFGFPLTIVYTIWLFVIIALYFPCRWYSKYKKTHNHWWLSYV